MKYLTVKVEQRHIDKGSSPFPDFQFCPLEGAVRELDPAAVVGTLLVNIVVEGTHQSIPLPRSAQKFIAAFDSGKPVHPATFRLEMPEGVK